MALLSVVETLMVKRLVVNDGAHFTEDHPGSTRDASDRKIQRRRAIMHMTQRDGALDLLKWLALLSMVLDHLRYVGYSVDLLYICLLYTSPSPRDRTRSRMPSSA